MARRKGTGSVLPLKQEWEKYRLLAAFATDPSLIPARPSVSRYSLYFWDHTILPSAARRKKRNSSRTADPQEEYIPYRCHGRPDATQASAMRLTIGCCRFLWNRMKSDYDLHKKEMGYGIFNTPAEYKSLDDCSFLKESDSYALCNVQLAFESAISDAISGGKGWPMYKKKHLSRASYTTNCKTGTGNVRLEQGCLLTLPKVPGVIRLDAHRPVREGGRLKSVTVVQEPGGEWYFSILFGYPYRERLYTDGIASCLAGEPGKLSCIGLDMSLPGLYVDSDGNPPSYTVNGEEVTFRKAYRGLEKKIAREQRRLSHMEKGSANYRKQCIRIAKLYTKAKQQRNDFLHQVAARLASSYDIIAIEDLDMSAMKQALKFGKSVSDNGWGNFTRILEEQCCRRGSLLIRVSRWFPSSKTCCHCGHILRELRLSDRVFLCPECGCVMGRDHQAAVNIREEALRIFHSIVSGQVSA